MDKLFFNNENEQIKTENLIESNNSKYLKARKYIGICNNQDLGKIMIYGSKSLELINSLSQVKFNPSSFKAGYTLLFKKNKFISEVIVYKISALRYIIAAKNIQKVYKILNVTKRKFPLTTISNVTNKYVIFSFHGNEVNYFFNRLTSPNLYCVSQQGYKHYHLLVAKKFENQALNYFSNLNFIPISLETKAIFLYNNNVIFNLETIKRNWKKRVFKTIYPNKSILNTDKKAIEIQQFEVQENVPVYKNLHIYNERKRKSGIVYCTYKVPNKKNPYIICFTYKNKISKTAIIKFNKKDILLKQYIYY